jgi:hypothetical protein
MYCWALKKTIAIHPFIHPKYELVLLASTMDCAFSLWPGKFFLGKESDLRYERRIVAGKYWRG